MTSAKIVFAMSNKTAYNCLYPIAKEVEEMYSVEYLLLDELFNFETWKLPRSQLRPYREVTDFLGEEYLKSIFGLTREPNQRQPILRTVFQRLLLDNFSPEIAFNIEEYLSTADPDVFVCSHDRLPFIKNVIKKSHERRFSSVVVQHGINRPYLESPSDPPGLPGFLTPSPNPRFRIFDYLKRRIGFRYGAFIFCNPYVDELYTMGDFFISHISNLRESYPCFGKTNVVATGATEFNPKTVTEYDPTVESALFLSQWQYENGDWGDKTQMDIVSLLKCVQNTSDIPVTVRPHPKESEQKMRRFFGEFPVSSNENLSVDIESHDAILTIDSTALFSAVLAGKPVGCLQPSGNENRFPPFTHEHIMQVKNGNLTLQHLANARSSQTQNEYLEKFCKVPALDPATPFETPVDEVVSHIDRQIHQ